MKAKVIIWSIVGVLVIALLVVLFLRPAIWDGFHISMPWLNYTYESANKYTAGDATVEGVKALDVEYTSGSVELVPYDGTAVVIEETANKALSEDEQVHWYLDGETLHVRFCKAGTLTLNNAEKHLTLKVPKSVVYSSVEVDVVSAELSVTGIEATQLELETVSGEIQLTDVRGKKLDCDSTSGRLFGSGIDYSELACDTVSGDISLAFAKGVCPDSAEFDSVSGGITLTLPKDSSFRLDFDSVSGDFNSALACSMQSGGYVCGSGDGSIRTDTVSGDLRILAQD